MGQRKEPETGNTGKLELPFRLGGTMKLRDLHARAQEQQLEASTPTSEQQTSAPAPTNYQALYQRTTEEVRVDCWSLDPAWLLAHPGFYEPIKALDNQLTTMERLGTSEAEYRATLGQLIQCVRDARAACEREQEQVGERAAQ